MKPLALAVLVATGAAAAEPDTTLDAVRVLGHYDNGVGTSNAASEGSVTARLLANRPALRPAEVLEFVPGLIVTQHSGDGKANQYFLRGFNLDHGTDFATFVDGMPVNMVSHAHGQGYSDLNFLIPELVNRIDYRKGPYAAADGDFGSAGSARIRLADTLPKGLAQVTFGQRGYRRGLLADTMALGTGTLLGALELQSNDGPWDVPEHLRKVNGWLRYADRDGEGSRSLTLMAYNARWNATDQIPADLVDEGSLGRFASLDPTDGGRTERVSLSGQATRRATDGEWRFSAYAIRSRLSLYSNFTYRLDDPVDGDQFEQSERRRVLGGEASRRWDVTAGGREQQFTLGLQARHDRLSPVGLYATAGRTRLGAADDREDTVSQSQLGLFGEWGATWTPWLRSVAGLRADTARFHVDAARASDHLVSPKLSFVFGPWTSTELFANWGQGFHSNDARGATDPMQPVPGLVKSRGGELGLRTEVVPGLQSSLALWQLDLDSELVYIGDAGTTEPSRASRRSGLEWNNHWQLDGWLGRAAAGWLADVDVAVSKARYRTDPGGEGTRVPGAVGRVVSAGLTWADPASPWSAAFQVRHFGPRDLTSDGTQRSRATTLAYLRGGWRVNPRTTVNLDVFNLFDRPASDIDYFYESAPPNAAAGERRHFHPVEPRTVRLTLAMQLR